MPIVSPTEDIFTETIRAELSRYGKQFRESMAQFLKLSKRLAELLDSSVTNDKVQVKTVKDVALLINAYAKLAEAENRIIASMTQFVEVLNTHDALTIALVSATRTDESVPTHFSTTLDSVLSESSDSEEE